MKPLRRINCICQVLILANKQFMVPAEPYAYLVTPATSEKNNKNGSMFQSVAQKPRFSQANALCYHKFNRLRHDVRLCSHSTIEKGRVSNETCIFDRHAGYIPRVHDVSPEDTRQAEADVRAAPLDDGARLRACASRSSVCPLLVRVRVQAAVRARWQVGRERPRRVRG